MTPNLKAPQKPGTGRIVHVTPENAGWTYVGFDLHRLAPGQARPRARPRTAKPALSSFTARAASAQERSGRTGRAHVAV